MENRILNEKQKLLVETLPQDILETFYLTGGTALSAFYLGHRLSNDLDFFAENDKQMPQVEYLAKLMQGLKGGKDLHFERLFDRRIFAVTFEDGDTLKVEFTSYPFPSVQERTKAGNLIVDSPLNIITGKLVALSDRYDPKDFVDIYGALKHFGWALDELVGKAAERFGVKGLHFLIPERLLLVRRIQSSDLPVMLKDLDLDEMKSDLVTQATDLARLRKLG